MSDDTARLWPFAGPLGNEALSTRWRTRGHSLEWQCNRLGCSCVFICRGVLERHDHETARLSPRPRSSIKGANDIGQRSQLQRRRMVNARGQHRDLRRAGFGCRRAHQTSVLRRSQQGCQLGTSDLETTRSAQLPGAPPIRTWTMKTTNDRAVARADDSFSRYVVGSGSPSWLRRWYGRCEFIGSSTSMMSWKRTARLSERSARAFGCLST
jgi:hypothetical protein